MCITHLVADAIWIFFIKKHAYMLEKQIANLSQVILDFFIFLSARFFLVVFRLMV